LAGLSSSCDTKDIHPKNKREVGRRLALNARASSHVRDGEWSGPWLRSLESTANDLRLTFGHASDGLFAKKASQPASHSDLKTR
jgi:sialate O-acetylesterase